MKRVILISALLMVASCQAQEPAVQNQPQTLTVPAGTHVAMTLDNTLTNKQAVPGAEIRAVTTFPISVGNSIAIPVGVFANGKLISISTKGGHSFLDVHFTQLIYPSGYTVNLDASNFNALVEMDNLMPERTEPILVASNGYLPMSEHKQSSRNASTPSVSMPGPNPVEIVVPIVATFAVLTTTMVIYAHHRSKQAIYPLYDAGWQFEMVLNRPLTIDLDKAGIQGAVQGK